MVRIRDRGRERFANTDPHAYAERTGQTGPETHIDANRRAYGFTNNRTDSTDAERTRDRERGGTQLDRDNRGSPL
ncbi:hypothetical protein F4009_12675 [Candidatus Poribacteria bacterium]|nr:hypothetical protein [Candidatus Poribacteria bacterium]